MPHMDNQSLHSADSADSTVPAIAVAALVGAIDAVAFLSLGGFFVSAMAANSLRLSAGVGANLDDAWLAVSLIIAFIGGVMGAGVINRLTDAPRAPARILSVVAVLTLTCALIAKPYQANQLLLLAAAMGAVTMVRGGGGMLARHGHVTGLLAQIGQALEKLAFGDGDARQIALLVMIWLGFVGGALIGAGLYWRIGLDTLWVLGGVSAGLAALLWWRAGPRADATAPPTP